MLNKLDRFVSHPGVVLTTYILGIISVLLGFSNTVLQVISLVVSSICFIVLLVFVIKFFLDKKKIREEIFEGFSSSLLNECSPLVCRIIEASLSAKNNDITDNELKESCRNICEKIRSSLKALCGIEFSVCIKEICTRELVNYDYSRGHTKTIVRVGEKSEERSRNDYQKQKISDNTSFEHLLSTNEEAWPCPNLEDFIHKYAQEGKTYKNPDKDYKKYYKSTIVVPVRSKGQYISPIIKEYSECPIQDDRPNCIAFLCIDSPLKFSLDDQRFTRAAVFLIMCGKALYPVFESKLENEIDLINGDEGT